MKHLKDIAIKTSFKRGSRWGNKLIVQRLYDHPAVTAEVYAEGLINSVWESMPNPTFNFLLKEADQDDLIAVTKHKEYDNYKEGYLREFREAIERAYLTAKPGGTRLKLSHQKNQTIKHLRMTRV